MMMLINTTTRTRARTRTTARATTATTTEEEGREREEAEVERSKKEDNALLSHHHDDDDDTNAVNSSLLSLLSSWSGVNVDKVYLGCGPPHEHRNIGSDDYYKTESSSSFVERNSPNGYRGLWALNPLVQGESILSPLPWKHVLGAFAARHLIDSELYKGRGIFLLDDDDDASVVEIWKAQLLWATGLDPLQVWSCTLACALLSALRYPLSPWSVYVASLPPPPPPSVHEGGGRLKQQEQLQQDMVDHSTCTNQTDTSANDGTEDSNRGRDSSSSKFGRIELALRRTHATIASRRERRMQMLHNKTNTTTTTMTTTNHDEDAPDHKSPVCSSKQQLQQLQQCILHKVPLSSLNHVFFFSANELEATGDDELIRQVQSDWKWMRRVWEIMFATSHNKNNNSNYNDTEGEQSRPPPLVSWESWLWAHAMVRSRAVGLPRAPTFVFAFEFDNFQLPPSTVHGVLLPIVDLINHGSGCSDDRRSNAALHITNEGVAVRATRDIDANQEILFDYHPGATLQFFFRTYGFIPQQQQEEPNNNLHSNDGNNEGVCGGGGVHHVQQFSLGRYWKLIVSRRTSNVEDSCMMMRLQVLVDQSQTTTLYISNHNDDKVDDDDDDDESSSSTADPRKRGLDLLQSSIAQQDPIQYFVFFHQLAALACRVAMQEFEEPPALLGYEKGASAFAIMDTALAYRRATFGLLKQAKQDMECCCFLETPLL